MDRCEWCGDDPLYVAYHDLEWGVPVHDDRRLFEFIVLEGAQAGLSWITILRKRDNYRRAFAEFDIATVAGYDDEDVARLLQDSGIVRNRQKVHSAVNNARAALDLISDAGSLSSYFWDWVDGEPIKHDFKTLAEIPATIPLAETLSQDMKRRGFTFFGPTIAYAHMQATGLVNDHVVSCFRYEEV